VIRETWHEKLTILFYGKLKLLINQHQALKTTAGTSNIDLQKSKLYFIHEQYFSWPQCVHERHVICTNNSVQGLLTEPI